MAKKKSAIRKLLTAIGVILLSFIAIALVGLIFSILPDPKNPSKGMLIATLTLSCISAVCGPIAYYKKEFWASVGVCLCVSVVFLLGAIHGISSVIPGWIWSLPLVVAFGLAWLLPIINFRWAKQINDEQFAPKTRLGKGCIYIFLGLGGTSGVCGALFGAFSLRLTGSANLGMIVLGIMCAFLALGFAQTFAYQLWERRQFEKGEIQEKTKG